MTSSENSVTGRSRTQRPDYEQQYQFWEELVTIAAQNDVDPWQALKPRNSNDLRANEVPGVLVSWTFRVRADDSFCNLWIDLGDPKTNVVVLRDLQQLADVSELGFEVTWDPKIGHQGCSVDAEPVRDCGLATDSATRLPGLVELLERDRLLQAALKPHVHRVVAPYL